MSETIKGAKKDFSTIKTGISGFVNRTKNNISGKIYNHTPNFVKNIAQKMTDSQVGVNDSLDKGKKLQIIKDKVRAIGDNAAKQAATEKALRNNPNMHYGGDYTVRKVGYEKSYDFGNGDTSITKDMRDEAAVNNAKKGGDPWKRKPQI